MLNTWRLTTPPSTGHQMFSIGMKGAARKHSIYRKGLQTLSCLHIPHFEGAVSGDGDNQATSTRPSAVTLSLWPERVRRSLPVAAPHTLRVRSKETEAIELLSAFTAFADRSTLLRRKNPFSACHQLMRLAVGRSTFIRHCLNFRNR